MPIDDHTKLLRSIANAIKRSKCQNLQIVHVLMSTAAGMAVVDGARCHEFLALAHQMHHDAENVLEEREPVTQAVHGVGGYKC